MADTIGERNVARPAVEGEAFTRRGEMPVRLSPNQGSIDFATLLGLVAALALIGGAIFLGGNWIAFLDVRAILLVVAGTFVVTAVSYSIREIIQAQPIMLRTLFHSGAVPNEAAMRMLQLSER